MRNIAGGEGLDGRSMMDHRRSPGGELDRDSILARKSREPRPMELYFRYLSRAVGKPSDTKPKRHNHLRELFAHRRVGGSWRNRGVSGFRRCYIFINGTTRGPPRARVRASERGRSISLRGFAKLRLCCRSHRLDRKISRKIVLGPWAVRLTPGSPGD